MTVLYVLLVMAAFGGIGWVLGKFCEAWARRRSEDSWWHEPGVDLDALDAERHSREGGHI